jgi:diguanylate cyclase (GGDEF)-like protein/PAS domain S-box-containing protein
MLDLQNAEVFRAALETLQAGVCVVDHERKIRYWNAGAEKITGYLCQEVLGRFCGDILLIGSHETKAALCGEYCPLVAAMRDGGAREARVYLHHKSGYAVPVSLRVGPIRDAKGHVVGATETFIERIWGTPRGRPDSNLAIGHGLDALTLLPDYAFTQSYLADRVTFAAQHLIPFGLLCIQLDHLDSLTATHGLKAGEAILNVIAHTLRNGIDSQDFVGRWSDDNFMVIEANCGVDELLTTADRLRRLAHSSEITWWGDELSVTVSVGGSVLEPGEPLEVLLGRVGSALQETLARGGNSAVVVGAPEIA